MSQSLGARIQERRKQLGLSQQQIADHLGKGRSNIGHIENDRVVPSSTDLDKIADLLKTTPNILLGKQPANQTPPEWATAKDIADFKHMLEDDGPIMFDGVLIEGEQRQRVMDILSGLFWGAKKTGSNLPDLNDKK